MTYVNENGVVVVATAGGSVDIYVGNHEQVIYPYTEEVPTILSDYPSLLGASVIK